MTIQPIKYGAMTIGGVLKGYKSSNLGKKGEVCKGLNLAIDRQAILKAMYPPGTADILNGSGLFSPGGVGDDPSLKAYPYQPDEAKALLAQSGYKGEQGTFWSFILSGLNPEQPQVND